MSKKIERNDPCWCGSGKKYKKCHEAFDEKMELMKKKGYAVLDHDLIKTPAQIEKIKESCKINVAVLDYVAEHIGPGVTTQQIDDWVHEETVRHGGIPAPLNYEGFPKSVCTSINEVVCHGIPDEEIVLKEGDYISLNGSTGEVYNGKVETQAAELSGDFADLMKLSDKYTRLQVRTNADTPHDAEVARNFGAVGIGLCRTEHMFFEEDRIAAFREMICSDTVEEREAALEKILPYQQGDFEALYEALEGNPVTIRFLDPPLHEFVPTEEADIEKLAKAQGKSVETIKNIIASLHEFNPMMGHRGCRLAVTYPEIAKMQTKAVIRAAINVQKKHSDWTVKPEIMIPLVCEVKELKYVKKVVVETADAEIAAAGVKLEYEVGTMIEIPRAALTADEIATEADFFCFGTNDLTQMTFGFSRDDAGKFLNAYYDTKIFENDPFAKLDQNGVGKLMDMAIKLGKPVNPKLHVGICGEHGGDPSSVEFCHKIGLDYVSCSPFRVPIARLAAAQAAISNK